MKIPGNKLYPQSIFKSRNFLIIKNFWKMKCCIQFIYLQAQNYKY